jgi:hypothetical protein
MYNNLEVGTTIKFFLDWMDTYEVGVIVGIEDGRYRVDVNNYAVKSILIEPNDIQQVIDKTKVFVPLEEEIIKEEPVIEEPVIEVKKYPFMGLFSKGGSADETIIDGLPNEVTIFVPLFDAYGKPANDNEIENRVEDVSDFVKRHFGEFLIQDIGSSYVDREGNLVMRKIIQITSYPTNEEFNFHKTHLVNQLSLWARDWEQEFMILEHEEDMYFILPLDDMMKQGGELWIQDAIEQMSKKGTIGAFTKQAKREGLTPIEFAKKVLKNPKGYTLKTRRRANFVKNVNPDKF